MTDEQQQALKRAFGAHLATAAAVLMAWKAGLSAEHAAKLDQLEGRGLRLGLSVNVPKDRAVIQIFLLDPTGQTAVVDTIEQSGSLPSVTVN